MTIPQEPERPDEDWSWANPRLKEQLESDPTAVLKDRGIDVPEEFPRAVVHEFVRVASLLWVEGEIVPLDRFYIDPSDEGLLFGRGVWESTRTFDGVPWLWPMHLERLIQSAEVLGIDVAPERLPDETKITEYVKSLTSQDVIVRLNVTAGRPGKTGVVWMSAAPIPHAPPSLRLATCRNPVQKGHAYLILKTFQYATRLRLGQEANQLGYDSALLLDDQGNLLEAAHANIFLRFRDGWATPPADGGLLPGTVRRHLLERAPMPMREQVIPYARVAEASEVFVTNSNLGIIPIVQVDRHSFPIGEETQNLIRWMVPPGPPGTHYRFVERQGTPR
jgi:branched-subunit amino acid aminotransferase/4-amino-4-deoxychorismate lyase